MFRHLHFPPNFIGLASWAVELNAALCFDTITKKIKKIVFTFFYKKYYPSRRPQRSLRDCETWTGKFRFTVPVGVSENLILLLPNTLSNKVQRQVVALSWQSLSNGRVLNIDSTFHKSNRFQHYVYGLTKYTKKSYKFISCTNI